MSEMCRVMSEISYVPDLMSNSPFYHFRLQRSTDHFKDELKKFEEIWYFSGLFVTDKSLSTLDMYNLFGNWKHKGMKPDERKLVISKGETPKKILDFANKVLENQENDKSKRDKGNLTVIC
eukprot:GHVP01056844.1.p1 GENE.GHVP01056844.1~~GHVP01056844.1.p1  ORF type:complete len:121 (+),score=22.94 GHVP01056844.1:14-376(+)